MAVLLLASLLAIAAALGCGRWGGLSPKYIGIALGGVSVVGFALLPSTSVLIDFVSGRTTCGSREWQRQITALAEPAKFNAALLTGSLARGVLLLARIAAIGVSFKRQP